MKIINTKYALQPQANDCGMHVIVCVCQRSVPGKECPPGPGQDRITRVNLWARELDTYSFPGRDWPGLKFIWREPGWLNYIAWDFENSGYPGFSKKQEYAISVS